MFENQAVFRFSKIIILVSFFVGLLSNFAFAHNPCKRELNGERQIVTEEMLRQNIATLKQRCGTNCDRDGFFGPGSMLWEVTKVPFLFLYAETELYLQLAHPVGAQGVWDFSDLTKNPIERFKRTFDILWRMTYSGASDVERLALVVQRMHTRVTGVLEDTAGDYTAGETYHANDIDALLWVHITDMYAKLRVYETFVRRLSSSEKDLFVADTVKFGMLFGIPESRLPKNWIEFRSYFDHMLSSGELSYTPVARRMEKHFRDMGADAARAFPMYRAIFRYSGIITANTMPPSLAKEWGYARSTPSRIVYGATKLILRNLYKRLPEVLKTLPLYRIAQDRAAARSTSYLDEFAYIEMVGDMGQKILRGGQR